MHTHTTARNADNQPTSFFAKSKRWCPVGLLCVNPKDTGPNFPSTASLYVCMYVCMYVDVLCVYIYVYLYVYTYIQYMRTNFSLSASISSNHTLYTRMPTPHTHTHTFKYMKTHLSLSDSISRNSTLYARMHTQTHTHTHTCKYMQTHLSLSDSISSNWTLWEGTANLWYTYVTNVTRSSESRRTARSSIACMRMCMCLCTDVCIYIFIYWCVYACVCICMCVCAWFWMQPLTNAGHRSRLSQYHKSRVCV
jgi:hypothetical protein